MKRIAAFAGFLVILAFGCASPNGIKDHNGNIHAGDSTKINVGMSKLEVMRALGKPETTSADANGETLHYRLERAWWQNEQFKVEIRDDKVTSFGVIKAQKP
jgi:hypothetical protein